MTAGPESTSPPPSFIDQQHSSSDGKKNNGSHSHRHLSQARARQQQEGGEKGNASSLASSNAPLLPPEFNACFPSSSVSRRKIRWGFWSLNDREWMKLVEDNYNIGHREAGTTSSLSSSSTDVPWLIPHTIHHVWLGGDIPRRFARLRDTWRSRHESWELRLWTEADIESFGLENKEAYDAAGNFGEKSDILRYEILLRHGGLYVDVDFLCLGAFDDLHRRYDFYAGVSNTGTFELNNGLVGCCPGHPIMRNVVNRIRETWSAPPVTVEARSCQGGPRDIGNNTPCLVAGALTGEFTPLAGVEGARIGSVMGASISGCGTVLDGKETGMRAEAGDPLATLMGAFGDGEGRGKGRGDVKGLLAGLLGDEDRACLAQAVLERPGNAMTTIAKTGPGAFTAAVMQWMVEATAGNSEAACHSLATVFDGGDRTTHRSHGRLAAVLSGDGEDRGAKLEPEPEPSSVMILPPSYFYPVPNNVVGDLVGDGSDRGVFDRAGHYFARESLAAHLWAKSWQYS